jgi:hypothetical protein
MRSSWPPANAGPPPITLTDFPNVLLPRHLDRAALVNPSKTADTLGYLSKPIDLQKLDEVLAVYADRRRSDLT